MSTLPFAESRRLTGANLFFDSPGAVLESVGAAIDERVLNGWRSRVVRARSSLRWPAPESRSRDRAEAVVARRHSSGTSFAIAAPFDQLFTATEVNEWALCAALIESDHARWGHLEAALAAVAKEAAQQAVDSDRIPIQVAFGEALPVIDEAAALARFAVLARIEAKPRLQALLAAASEHALLRVLDDDALTLGSGVGGRTWPIDILPDVSDVPWPELHDVPSAVVTGSNGKTTTVRLLAAFARAQGWRDGYNCTDGLFIAAEQVDSGDYSGPVGARTVLRDARVEAAILEIARGGMLRRGIAVERADVAVITNVSPDHFGEYGIDDLEGIADVKFVVASTVGNAGLLVLNADDPVLRARAQRFGGRIAWFSRDYEHEALRRHRANAGATSGVRDGRLVVSWGQESGEFDLGAIARMPLTVDGSAEYNVSNIAGAVLAAFALGIPGPTVARVLSRFGAEPMDNPGRLMRYEYRGAQVLIDYAHNPDGLKGLMTVAMRLRRTGRIGLVLGQAGNRTTRDIEALAAAAAGFRPDFIVVKEMETMLRGRAPGEVPGILLAALLRAGLPRSSIDMRSSEIDAVRRALEWSQSGDVLVLPVHARDARTAAVGLIAEGG